MKCRINIIQGDAGGKVSIFGGGSIGDCEEKFRMVTEIELFECTDVTTLDLCLCGLMKSEVNKRQVDTQTNCWLAFWMLLPA